MRHTRIKPRPSLIRNNEEEVEVEYEEEEEIEARAASPGGYTNSKAAAL